MPLPCACREVVRSPMVEAQCSVQICFPVELQNETMVFIVFSSNGTIDTHEGSPVIFSDFLTFNDGCFLSVFPYVIDGRYSLCWFFEQTSRD